MYLERHAHAATLRRRKAAKETYRVIDGDVQLAMNIEALLKNTLSPEQIAGYMKRVGHLHPVCHQTIYNWIHRRWQSHKAYLRFRGRPRVPYGAGKRF